MNNIKNVAETFIKKHKLTIVDYSALKNTATEMGYTIIEYDSVYNDTDVETVIHNLDLGQVVLQSRGFTYADKNHRLIFINEELTEDEKVLVLAHELGHIECGHLSSQHIIGRDVIEEHEANEFLHYLLKQDKFRNIKNILNVHRKGYIAIIVIICLIVGSLIVYNTIQNKKVYEDNLYITTTGGRYHKKECIFVKNKNNIKKITKKEFESGNYIPCDMCLPDIK